ncbi:MAG TPA: 23S rRNA (uracil(1939)-C(5))-methyltransferase RlmD [Gammaproteobacteria bacterium]|nr:23S rRNA (uracil(1939)-C(5))-methyltransferase RlmD [Gammaproteobacteria bacterium]
MAAKAAKAGKAGQAEPVEAEIVDLTHDGQGVADVGGRRVFVAGTLPEERVVIAPRKRRRKYQEAELLSVVRPAADRVVPRCEYFGVCGGCALQHLDYQAQVRFKQRAVEQTLARVGGVSPEAWLPPILGPEWNYRRRARLGVKYVEGKGRVLVGFRERAAPYIADMRRCPVLVPPFDSLLGELAAEIEASGVARRLPQIEVAAGDAASAIVLRVLDAPSERDRARFVELGARHGIDVYLQTGGPGTVAPLGPAAETLRYRLDRFDVTLEFAPTDFIQINGFVNARMVEAAVEIADVGPTDRVLDLYCGLGNFSLPFARFANEVLGVEGEAGLVARAVRNAASNGLANARFIAGDLADASFRFYREPWDLVVLDPPRTGAAEPIEQIAKLRPRRVVYVSCHPATLARDAKVLTAAGFRLESARVLDMFPHTHHVEAMALFVRPD